MPHLYQPGQREQGYQQRLYHQTVIASAPATYVDQTGQQKRSCKESPRESGFVP